MKMKKCLFLCLLVLSSGVMAESPKPFDYQAQIKKDAEAQQAYSRENYHTGRQKIQAEKSFGNLQKMELKLAQKARPVKSFFENISYKIKNFLDHRQRHISLLHIY